MFAPQIITIVDVCDVVVSTDAVMVPADLNLYWVEFALATGGVIGIGPATEESHRGNITCLTDVMFNRMGDKSAHEPSRWPTSICTIVESRTSYSPTGMGWEPACPASTALSGSSSR